MNGFNNPMMRMMVGQLQSNPLFHQAQQMAHGKTPQEIQQICANICKSKGLDLNQAWSQFQSQFPGLR